jgi:type III restriction enzyme
MAIVAGEPDAPRLRPILRPYDQIGSTRQVDFDTTKKVYATAPDKCHVSHVVEDSSWESKLAQVLEDMPDVVAYVKNQGLGFAIPYTLNGAERQYYPDYIVRMRAGGEVVSVIVEVSGQNLKDIAAKTSTAKSLWVPAVNNQGAFGRWGFVEITDPWNAQNEIRAAAQDAADAVRSVRV